MKDISKLESRVENLEYFSTLNASEQSLLSYEVPDAVTGLNRFKTGYLVDNFSNPFTVCDYFNCLIFSRNNWALFGVSFLAYRFFWKNNR